MYTETNNRETESHKILQLLMVLLNIGVLLGTAFVGWSIYKLIVRSSEIYNLFSGNMLT